MNGLWIGAGLLTGMIGIGGGIVVVFVVYFGLVTTGIPRDEAVHVAFATSLAAILPAAMFSFLAHCVQEIRTSPS